MNLHTLAVHNPAPCGSSSPLVDAVVARPTLSVMLLSRAVACSRSTSSREFTTGAAYLFSIRHNQCIISATLQYRKRGVKQQS